MQHDRHAQKIAARFRELVEEAGNTLPDSHYDELALLIEAGIDTALAEGLEHLADKLENLTKDIRRDAERFS
jgi:hypothetical protein